MSITKAVLIVMMLAGRVLAQTEPAVQDLSAFKQLLSEREAAYQVPLSFEFTDTTTLADGVPHVSGGVAFVNGKAFAASGTNEPPQAAPRPGEAVFRREYIVHSDDNSGGVWTKPNGVGLEYFDLAPPLPADVESAKANIEMLAPPSPYRFSLGDGRWSFLEFMAMYETPAGKVSIRPAVAFPSPDEAVLTLSYTNSANGVGAFFTAIIDVTGEPKVKRIEGRDRKGVLVRTVEIIKRARVGAPGREVDCVEEWLETTYAPRASDEEPVVIKRTRRVQMRGFHLADKGTIAARVSLFSPEHGVPDGAEVVRYLKDGTKQILRQLPDGEIEIVSSGVPIK